MEPLGLILLHCQLIVIMGGKHLEIIIQIKMVKHKEGTK
jgi:hypothetical protein